MKRSKVSKKGSERLFRTTASRVHEMNLRDVPMRGGFRI